LYSLKVRSLLTSLLATTSCFSFICRYCVFPVESEMLYVQCVGGQHLYDRAHLPPSFYLIFLSSPFCFVFLVFGTCWAGLKKKWDWCEGEDNKLKCPLGGGKEKKLISW
jgi:hypothetical protein